MEASPEFGANNQAKCTNENVHVLIERFKGSLKERQTIRATASGNNVALNYKHEGLRVLLDFDGRKFRKNIAIRLTKKFNDFKMVEENKILVMFRDNTLDLLKFHSFGHYEKIANCISVCPHRNAATHSMVLFQP